MAWWQNEFILFLFLLPSGIGLIGVVLGLLSRRAWSGLVVGVLATAVFAWRVHQPALMVSFYLPLLSLPGFLGSAIGWGVRKLLRR